MSLADPIGHPLPGAAKSARSLRRRPLLAATAGLVAPALPRFAQAAEVTWCLGHNAPKDFALHQRLIEAAAAIATESAGEMKLEIYPNSERGSSIGLFTQLRAGTIDVVPVTCQVLGSNLALGALPMVGFAFGDYNAVWTALDGGLGGYLRAQMSERLGLIATKRCWNFGFRQVTTSGKVVKEAADIEGLRLRTPAEADFVGLFQALKVLPVAMPLSGLGTALKNGAIDGQEGMLPLVEAAKLYEAQSTCALTSHVWDGHWMCISGQSWSGLSQKLREIVSAAFDGAAMHQREDIAASEAKTRQALEAVGMRFNTVDANSFRQVLRKAGYYQAWQTRMGAEGWSALEKYSGRLV